MVTTEQPPLQASLRAAADAMGLQISAPQTDALLHYLTLLQRWNKVYNLTAVREPGQMLTLHLVDCLATIEPIRRHLAARTDARLLDVGSGAGLPAVVIAALNPTLAVTSVETVGKKAAFIRQVATELHLPNLSAEHARVEAMKAQPFDMVISRAFASLPDFVKLTRHHLKANGVWIAMKGKPPTHEMAELPDDVQMFHVEPLQIPGLDAERCLVWIRPRQRLETSPQRPSA